MNRIEKAEKNLISKIVACAITVIIICVFAPSVHATILKENSVYLISFDEKDNIIFIEKTIKNSAENINEKIKNNFEYILEQTQIKQPFPKGTKFLGSSFSNNCLTVNFSQELTQYGGSFTEFNILTLVKKNAKELGFEKVSITVDGKLDALPEGMNSTFY